MQRGGHSNPRGAFRAGAFRRWRAMDPGGCGRRARPCRSLVDGGARKDARVRGEAFPAGDRSAAIRGDLAQVRGHDPLRRGRVQIHSGRAHGRCARVHRGCAQGRRGPARVRCAQAPVAGVGGARTTAMIPAAGGALHFGPVSGRGASSVLVASSTFQRGERGVPRICVPSSHYRGIARRRSGWMQMIGSVRRRCRERIRTAGGGRSEAVRGRGSWPAPSRSPGPRGADGGRTTWARAEGCRSILRGPPRWVDPEAIVYFTNCILREKSNPGPVNR